MLNQIKIKSSFRTMVTEEHKECKQVNNKEYDEKNCKAKYYFTKLCLRILQSVQDYIAYYGNIKLIDLFPSGCINSHCDIVKHNPSFSFRLKNLGVFDPSQ